MQEKNLRKEGYLNQLEAAKYLGIGLSTIKKYRKVFDDFPKPFVLSSTAVFFKKSELDEWMEKRRLNGA